MLLKFKNSKILSHGLFCGGVDLPFYMWCTTQVELWKKEEEEEKERNFFMWTYTRR